MKIIIYCDGGLGNRMGALIGGLLISKAINRQPIIVWPENACCEASFTDLFENNYEIINTTCNDLYSKYLDSVFFVPFNHSTHDIKRVDVNFENFQQTILKCDNPNIIYNNHAIPNFLNHETNIVNVLSELKIKKNIVRSVNDFCFENKIDKNVLGIQIRRTDATNSNYDNFIENFIKDCKNTIFLCSDDKSTEDDFQSKYNVHIHKKTHYVEKKNKDLGWNGEIIDENGLKWPYNVYRSKLSVIEAFVDLLILSRTSIFQGYNVGSTFLTLAKYYQNIQNLPESE